MMYRQPTAEIIHDAIKAKDLEEVRRLIKDGADINAKAYRCEPLHFAVKIRDLDIAKFLIDNGADINAKDAYGKTPLHDAISQGNLGFVELAKLLLDNGADVNAKNKYGETPLNFAAFGGNLAIANLLIDSGADVNAKDIYGRTPLYWAIQEWPLSKKYFVRPRRNFYKERHKEVEDYLKSKGGVV